MKPDGCGGWMRDYSGERPGDLRDRGLGGLQECVRMIESHEILDAVEDATEFEHLRSAVLRLAQFVTGEK